MDSRDARPPAQAGAPDDSVDLVWAEGTRLVAQQLADARDLDAKTAGLVGLASAALALVAAQRSVVGDLIAVLLPEIAVVLALLLLSLRLRSFANIPALPAFIVWTNASAHESKLQFMGNMLEAYEENQDSLANKRLYLQVSIYGMLLVVLTSVIAIAAGRATP